MFTFIHLSRCDILRYRPVKFNMNLLFWSLLKTAVSASTLLRRSHEGPTAPEPCNGKLRIKNSATAGNTAGRARAM